jgi:hypothetical protein
MINKILDFIASKWFVLGLMIVMALFLPTTWNNLQVVRAAGMLSKFWYIGLVFACNLLGTIFAFWKFMALITTKEQKTSTW